MGQHTYVKTRKFKLVLLDPPHGEGQLQHLYPERFRNLLQQVQEALKAKSETYFTETSLRQIKKQVINNNPALMPANIQRDDTDVRWITRTIWSSVGNVYYAYREKKVRDEAVQYLASQMADPQVIPPDLLKA